MKRFHIHVGVTNIEKSVDFYSTLFGQRPTKLKDDYAKWMLGDPRLNFAISTRVATQGVDHLGIQAEADDELTEITDRLRSAGVNLSDEGETTCCYSKSKKAWITDPSGIAWEAYRNMNDVDVFKEVSQKAEPETSCCAPEPTAKSSC
jgi:catechol 2,3-dioxygenase-like lactoylglutathione lyase family enzyme